MEKTIFISIKEKYINQIVLGKKNYEFRSRIPQKNINIFFVYTSSKPKVIEYILEVGKVIKYPNQIEENGIGNQEFNNGDKKYIFAFPIKHVSKLLKPISLEELRKIYLFNPPQSFMYASTNKKLCNFIKSSKKELIY